METAASGGKFPNLIYGNCTLNFTFREFQLSAVGKFNGICYKTESQTFSGGLTMFSNNKTFFGMLKYATCSDRVAHAILINK